MTRLPRRSVTLLALLALVLSPAAPALAHGSFESNLADQTFEQTPAVAEFTSAVPVVLETAKGTLRYLGSGEVSADAFFATDVPTVELSLVGPARGAAESFAFALPRLGPGSYALDWEVTPEGDHATQSVQLLEVTVGVSDPDPTPSPPVPSTTTAPQSQADSPATSEGTSSSGALPAIAGAIFLLVVAGGIALVVRSRKGA